MLFKLLLVSTLFIYSSCSSSSIAIHEFTERPEFISGISTSITEHSDPAARQTICIEFNVPFLWMPGDMADDLNNHLVSNTQLRVDDKTKELDIGSNSLLSLHLVYDEKGNEVGSYSDLTLCYDIDDVAIGSHRVTVQTLTTAQEQYSYSFELIIR